MTSILPPDWQYDDDRLTDEELEAKEKSDQPSDIAKLMKRIMSEVEKELAEEQSDAVNFGAIIDRIVTVNDVNFGVQYPPGAVRFPNRNFAKRLKSGYGHARGCVGYSGKALRAYLAPGLLKDAPEGSDRMWEIYQRRPETGELDDVKLMVGYDDEQSATGAYLEEMPISFFGGIREIKSGDLEAYRKATSFAEPLQVEGDELTDEQWKNLTQISPEAIDDAMGTMNDEDDE